MLDLYLSSTFKKQFKKIKKRGYPVDQLGYVVDCLRQGEPLEARYRDHSLTGNYKDFRECHIQPDWLLVYQVKQDILTLVLARKGTHSDIF